MTGGPGKIYRHGLAGCSFCLSIAVGVLRDAWWRLPEEARHRGIKILYTDCHAATVLLPGWQRIENSPLYSLDLATGA